MGESWRPSTDFEDEMMSIQPDCDLIFPDHGKNPESLAGDMLMSDDFQKIFRENGESHQIPTGRSKELQIVGKIRNLIPARRLVGRMLTEDDLVDEDREAETIAMIRSTGMAPCYDFPLESKNTLPTMSTKDSYKISNGHPVLLDSEFFKLKPRSSSSEASTTKSSELSSDTSNGSIQFKTFTLIDSDESILQGNRYDDKSVTDSSSSNFKAKISPPPSNPQVGTKSRSKAINKISEQSQTERELRISKIRSSEESDYTNYRRDSFITPRELYMKKRATKS